MTINIRNMRTRRKKGGFSALIYPRFRPGLAFDLGADSGSVSPSSSYEQPQGSDGIPRSWNQLQNAECTCAKGQGRGFYKNHPRRPRHQRSARRTRGGQGQLRGTQLHLCSEGPTLGLMLCLLPSWNARRDLNNVLVLRRSWGSRFLLCQSWL